MAEKLSDAETSLVRLMSVFSRRYVTFDEAQRHSMAADFDRCRKAGMLISAGYETSARAEEWLDSPAGRAALAGGSRHDGE